MYKVPDMSKNAEITVKGPLGNFWGWWIFHETSWLDTFDNFEYRGVNLAVHYIKKAWWCKTSIDKNKSPWISFWSVT